MTTGGVVTKVPHTFPSHCNVSNTRAPCACALVLTTLNVHKYGKVMKIEFLESVCNKVENEEREREGRIARGYACKQLFTDQTVYRDVSGREVEVSVVYKAGCELRCTTQECKRRMKGLPLVH